MAQEQNQNFLEVKHLFVEYTSEGQVIKAVNDVSFTVKQGHTLGLVGETGAGKTSIAKAIMRILPNPPARVPGGEVWLEGTELYGLKEEEMRKMRGNVISMIFQDPMTALNPVMRVSDQIAEVVMLHNHISDQEARERAVKMLEMVGIAANRAGEYPHQFSGGMKQRVVIAMALACRPKLLLADEPTTALDVTIQAQVLDMINELKKQLNTAMIMITHDLGVVAEVCDDVAVVYAGEIIETGSKEAVFDRPAHPYTIGLFGALPDLKKDVKRLSPIQGAPSDPTNLPKGCKFHPRCAYATDRCRENACGLTELPGDPGHFVRCHKGAGDQGKGGE